MSEAIQRGDEAADAASSQYAAEVADIRGAAAIAEPPPVDEGPTVEPFTDPDDLADLDAVLNEAPLTDEMKRFADYMARGGKVGVAPPRMGGVRQRRRRRRMLRTPPQ